MGREDERPYQLSQTAEEATDEKMKEEEDAVERQKRQDSLNDDGYNSHYMKCC
jgi:hypothetical protein